MKLYPSHFISSPQSILCIPIFMLSSVKCAYSVCSYVFAHMMGSKFWADVKHRRVSTFNSIFCFKHKNGIMNACLHILVSFILGMSLSCTVEYYDSIVYTKRYLICLDILLFRIAYFKVRQVSIW